MPFDYKKEYKEFYMPKNKPEIVKIPPISYVAVRRKGNPNVEGGDYQQAISILYAVSVPGIKHPSIINKRLGNNPFFPFVFQKFIKSSSV